MDISYFQEKGEWLKKRGYEMRLYRFTHHPNDVDAYEFIIKIEMGGVTFYSTLTAYAVLQMTFESLEYFDRRVWENAREEIHRRLKGDE